MFKYSILIFCCTLLPVAHGNEEKKTPLGEQMSAFEDLYKAMRDEQDPQQAAAMARKAENHLIKALSYSPAVLGEIKDSSSRAKAEAKYRRMISQTLVLMCQIEEAYLKGDLASVKRLRSIMMKLKEAGHDEFVDE